MTTTTPAQIEVGPTDAGAIAAHLLATMDYFDIFGFPPNIRELHRYFHGMSVRRALVAAAVRRLVTENRLISQDGYFALPNRAHFFEQRQKREAHARTLWPRARRYAAILASIPTVRFVGVTGSLALDNTETDADIDFMLIVDPGTVWRTRSIGKLIELLDHRLGGNMCVNYIRSSKALALEERSLYIARELVQMVPLFGRTTYRALREANLWSRQYLPNAQHVPRTMVPVKPSRAARLTMRPFLLSPVARAVENWERDRKLERYNETDFLPGNFSRFSAEATGHRLHVRDEIEQLHSSRAIDRSDSRRRRVLFGQSYHLYFDPKLWREMKPYPPLGSLYGAAIARQAGCDVRFFDAMLATSHAAWRLALDRHRPDIVVLYEDNFNYLTKMCLLRMREAAQEMIAAANRIGARVIVCSADATDNARLYIDHGADFVIRGEGEKALDGLLRWLSSTTKDDACPVAGISYQQENGTLCNNPAMPLFRDLDELPLPAWDLVDLERYRSIWRRRHGYFSINLVTTRGCPYHCNWCAKPIWGQSYSVRSPENVAHELDHLVRLIGPDHVWFMDDIFGLKPGWVKRFSEILEECDLRIRFKCLTRPDLLRRPGEIDALAEAGCEVVWIGAESGSQKILDAMEKGTTVRNIEGITAALRERHIRVGYFIQFGYPGEAMDDIRLTLRMLRRTLPDELGISVSYPLPGTQFYRRVQQQLEHKRNWVDSSDLAMLYHGPFDTRFYRALHSYVHRNLGWHRTLRCLRDGSLIRLRLWQQARRLAGFTVNSCILPFTRLRVLIAGVLSRRHTASLPIDLDRQTSATPSIRRHD